MIPLGAGCAAVRRFYLSAGAAEFVVVFGQNGASLGVLREETRGGVVNRPWDTVRFGRYSVRFGVHTVRFGAHCVRWTGQGAGSRETGDRETDGGMGEARSSTARRSHCESSMA